MHKGEGLGQIPVGATVRVESKGGRKLVWCVDGKRQIEWEGDVRGWRFAVGGGYQGAFEIAVRATHA